MPNALLEQPEVMNTAKVLLNTDDFLVPPVDHRLRLYRMALFFLEQHLFAAFSASARDFPSRPPQGNSPPPSSCAAPSSRAD